jgi:hypothetical protein
VGKAWVRSLIVLDVGGKPRIVHPEEIDSRGEEEPPVWEGYFVATECE